MFSETITSDQFEKLLAALGYQLVPSNGPQRVYENREFDAIKILPVEGKEVYARVEHLMALRTISIAKGIVDADTFQRLLKEISTEAELDRDAA